MAAPVIVQLLLLGVLTVEGGQASSQTCNSNQPITRVFPLQRRISYPATTAGCHQTQSGLLLEMTDGKACVLEYSTDGKARLYAVSPVYYNYPCWWKKCYIVSTAYTGNYRWSRDTNGDHLNLNSSPVTPKSARDTMQSIMGHQYHLTKRNSHQAQQSLRKMWKLPVHDTYPNPRSICSCIPRTMSYSAAHDLYSAYQMASKACNGFVHRK